MDILRIGGPFSVINHAYNNGYYSQPSFEWIQKYLDTVNEMEEFLRIYKTEISTTKKFKLGIEVSRTWKHVLELDKLNGNDG